MRIDKYMRMDDNNNDFELSLRILGNEVLGLKLSSSTIKNKWLLLGYLTLVSSVTAMIVYGQDLIQIVAVAVN